MSDNQYEYNGVDIVPKDVVHVSIKEGITLIPHSTFYECHNLESVTIPNTVMKIDYAAFYDCDSDGSRVDQASVILSVHLGRSG